MAHPEQQQTDQTDERLTPDTPASPGPNGNGSVSGDDYGADEAHKKLSSRLREMDSKHGTAGNRLFYLSTPPNTFAPIISCLGEMREAYRSPQQTGFERIVAHVGSGEADQRELFRQQLLAGHLIDRRDQLSFRQIAAGAEDHDGTRVGRGSGGHRQQI